MRIRMKTSASGPEWSAAAGEELVVPAYVGRDLIAGGFAEDITTAPDAETTSTAQPETTELPHPARRRPGRKPRAKK